MFVLVDADSFYASCETVFNPGLSGSPVIVLSNNDGCVIARNKQAKKLGIPMGQPVFKMTRLLEANRVAVFSANYTLYGDLSRRLMTLLQSFSPSVEIYSIDEAFLQADHISEENLFEFGKKIVMTARQYLDLPVSAGIGPTKTLAKAASWLAKKQASEIPVKQLGPASISHDELKNVPVENIWGIGERYARRLKKMGIDSAAGVATLDPAHIRNVMGVGVQRTVLELNGSVCYLLDENPERNKELTVSRSFGKNLSTPEEVRAATAEFATVLGAKLRRRKVAAQTIIVFLMTAKYTRLPRYANYSVIHLANPANDDSRLIRAAVRGIDNIFREGYLYKKSGIMVTETIPIKALTANAHEGPNDTRQQKLAGVIDRINRKSGLPSVKYAIQGDKSLWQMKQHHLSPRYTTRWDEIPLIYMDDPLSDDSKTNQD